MASGNSKWVALAAGAVVVLGGGYLGTAAYFASKQVSQQLEWRAKLLALREVITAQTRSMRAATDLAPLGEACKDKLPPKGFKAVLAYLDPGDLPQSTYHAGEVSGYEPDTGSIGYDFMSHADEVPELSWKFREALDPYEWHDRRGGVDVDAASYLVITLPLHITYPRLNEDDTGFSEGKGELRTRVLSRPGNQVLCEGVSTPRTPDSLKTSARGKTQEIAKARASIELMDTLSRKFSSSIMYLPLVELCQAADEKYCKLVTDWME